ncbi:MAG: DUF721 domain-containing protein [Gammaproteobacteria bacterium]|nr:DUF721 domain-containing protein [Gammaproteobacteria bacterium]
MVKKAKHRTIAIQEFLKGNTEAFAALQKRAAELQLIHEQIQSILPPPLGEHFTLANVNHNCLTLHTDSPAWAARLRFKTAEILNTIKPLCDTNPPKSIRIKVVPPVSVSTKPKHRQKMSGKNAQLILDTANSINDPLLRDALNRLSKRGMS